MAWKNQKYHRLTPQDIDAIWARLQEGYAPMVVTATALGLPRSTVRDYLIRCGGIKPVPRQRRQDRLTFEEREEISRGLAAGQSLRVIAAGLGRAPSTVSREVRACGGLRRYRAAAADKQAWSRATAVAAPADRRLAQSGIPERPTDAGLA